MANPPLDPTVLQQLVAQAQQAAAQPEQPGLDIAAVPPELMAQLGGQDEQSESPQEESSEDAQENGEDAGSSDSRFSCDEVNYGWGHCCGTCTHYMHPESCKLVNGHVRADGICDYYQCVRGLPSDCSQGDGF